MKIIFYLSSLVFIFKELKWILSPIDETIKTKNKEKFIIENKNIKWELLTDDQKSEYRYLTFYFLFIFGWMFIGLFTFQWQAFLAFLMFQFIVVAPISKLTKYNFAYTILNWLNSILGLSFILFAIINSYHLKIDVDLIKFIR